MSEPPSLPDKTRHGVNAGIRSISERKQALRDLAIDLKANPGVWKPLPEVVNVDNLVWEIRHGLKRTLGIGFDAKTYADDTCRVGRRVWAMFDGKTFEQRESERDG